MGGRAAVLAWGCSSWSSLSSGAVSRSVDRRAGRRRSAVILRGVVGLVARPVLFLDVDGPLIPFGAPEGYPGAAARQRALSGRAVESVHPLLGRVDPDHGRRLSALPCELVWASTWGREANAVVAPLLGLPALPVVEWPDRDEDGWLHWKTRCLVEWAAGRPFVWVDDEISELDRAWVGVEHPGPALLHRVDPRRGLVESDFATIADWLAGL
jgi:Swiss Army Knife RNA repair-like protein